MNSQAWKMARRISFDLMRGVEISDDVRKPCRQIPNLAFGHFAELLCFARRDIFRTDRRQTLRRFVISSADRHHRNR